MDLLNKIWCCEFHPYFSKGKHWKKLVLRIILLYLLTDYLILIGFLTEGRDWRTEQKQDWWGNWTGFSNHKFSYVHNIVPVYYRQGLTTIEEQ